MARSVETIYNSMVSEKQGFAQLSALMPEYNLAPPTPDNPFRKLLDDINNNSKMGIWRGALLLVSFAIHSFEMLQDIFKTEVDALAKQSVSGTMAWYAAQVKLWQFGYALIWDSATFKYFYSDSTSSAAIAARLVTKVSITEVFGINTSAIQIKVAKTVGGVLTPLDDAAGSELESLETYVNRIKFAGVQTSVLSLPADSIRLTLKRYYDGTLDLDAVKTADADALDAFLKDIDFDGVLYINSIIDAFQKLTSSKQPAATVINCECKADSDSTWTVVNEFYSPVSGYFTLIPIGNTIGVDTYIEYIPE